MSLLQPKRGGDRVARDRRGERTEQPKESVSVLSQDVGKPPAEIVETSTEAEPQESKPKETLPNGLRELSQDGDSEKVATLLDQWMRRVTDDGVEEFVNNRDFNTKDGCVPQGTVRTLEEAYALEVLRRG